jgi:hypothetical protein
MIGLFIMLLRRWRAELALLLALVATGDSLLTAHQAFVYNLQRAQSVLDAFGIGLALVGPALAAAFLWLTRHD